jgi:hypothetical protein
MSTCDLEITRILTNYAQNPPWTLMVMRLCITFKGMRTYWVTYLHYFYKFSLDLKCVCVCVCVCVWGLYKILYGFETLFSILSNTEEKIKI